MYEYYNQFQIPKIRRHKTVLKYATHNPNAQYMRITIISFPSKFRRIQLNRQTIIGWVVAAACLCRFRRDLSQFFGRLLLSTGSTSTRNLTVIALGD